MLETTTTSTNLPSSKIQQPQILIRPATAVDLSQVAHIGSTTFASTFGYSMPASDLSAYLSSAYSSSGLLSDFHSPNVSIIVAVASTSRDQVLGFAQLRRDSTEPCLEGLPNQMELQRLYVSEASHGLGIGKKLIAEMERMARSEGARNLWLGVWEENHKAQAVYRKAGFEKVGTHDFVMGECVQTDWILVKRL